MAIETYREGLAELPSTREPDPPPSLKGKEKAVEADAGSGATSGPGVTEDERAELDECRELRAMLSANVAACHLKLVSRNPETFESIAGCEKSADLDRNAQQRWKEAVSACDEGASRGEAPGILEAPILIHIPVSTALESRQDYVKALHRRATANEAIGSWSSLQSALDGTSLRFSSTSSRVDEADPVCIQIGTNSRRCRKLRPRWARRSRRPSAGYRSRSRCSRRRRRRRSSAS